MYHNCQEACASLLALHLLDSMPLTDLLAVFLRQRSRTLHALHASVTDPSSMKAYVPNQTPTMEKVSERSRRKAMREIGEALQRLLDAITNTVSTARNIFGKGADETPSMMGQALIFIHSDSPSIPSSSLLPDLQLTTPILLTTLPSSTHFLLLPPNIKSYKPFIDLSSPSSSITQVSLTQKLQDWFNQATVHLKEAVGNGLDSLETIKDVWEVRSLVHQWVSCTEGLEIDEKGSLANLVDELCHTRVEKIWKSVLNDVETTFKKHLALLASEIRLGRPGSEAGTNFQQFTSSPDD